MNQLMDEITNNMNGLLFIASLVFCCIVVSLWRLKLL